VKDNFDMSLVVTTHKTSVRNFVDSYSYYLIIKMKIISQLEGEL